MTFSLKILKQLFNHWFFVTVIVIVEFVSVQNLMFNPNIRLCVVKSVSKVTVNSYEDQIVLMLGCF